MDAKIWRLRIAAVVLALFVSVVVAELGLRVLGISYPILHQPDPVAGATLIPDLDVWYSMEGRARVRTNSQGYRDRQHDIPKPASEWRFALLGDSYTEAAQVEFDETYWNIAARRLEQCPALEGMGPMPLSFGVSGYDTAQQLETLRQRVWAYEPDAVVLAFVPNDIPDNHPGIGQRDARPYYSLGIDGELVLDDSFRESDRFRSRTSFLGRMRRDLVNRSRIAQLLVELQRVFQRREVAASLGATGGKTSGPPKNGKWAEAWEITEALVAEIGRRVVGRDRHFLLLAVSSPHQVNPDPAYRIARMEAIAGTDEFYWNERLGALADREGFDYLSLSEPLQAVATATGECLHGFDNAVVCGGHWNQAGHREAGKRLAAALCEQASRGTAPLRPSAAEVP